MVVGRGGGAVVEQYIVHMQRTANLLDCSCRGIGCPVLGGFPPSTLPLHVHVHAAVWYGPAESAHGACMLPWLFGCPRHHAHTVVASAPSRNSGVVQCTCTVMQVMAHAPHPSNWCEGGPGPPRPRLRPVQPVSKQASSRSSPAVVAWCAPSPPPPASSVTCTYVYICKHTCGAVPLLCLPCPAPPCPGSSHYSTHLAGKCPRRAAAAPCPGSAPGRWRCA